MAVDGDGAYGYRHQRHLQAASLAAQDIAPSGLRLLAPGAVFCLVASCFSRKPSSTVPRRRYIWTAFLVTVASRVPAMAWTSRGGVLPGLKSKRLTGISASGIDTQFTQRRLDIATS
jgi:hypothetical protein